MTEGLEFKAPWGMSLLVMTTVGCTILLAVPFISVVAQPQKDSLWRVLTIVLPLVILFVTLLYSVRGYLLTDSTLQVQRLGWSSKIELTNLINVEIDPQAMERSIRLWGNGGLFSFTGNFRNHKLGFYQAYATDPHRAVILKFPQCTIVLTPDNPERFVSEVLNRQNS